jgi:phosphoketolase
MAGKTEVSADIVTPLTHDELRKIDAYWRACNYLAAGMIYLRANPLLREPLRPTRSPLTCSDTFWPT